MQFVKLTNEKENYNEYQFKTRYNVDSIPFNLQWSCQPGEIYFCEISKPAKWLYYSGTIDLIIYFRYVTIPDDVEVYIELNKFKTDKIILSERQKINDLHFGMINLIVWKPLSWIFMFYNMLEIKPLKCGCKLSNEILLL